jgi:hypothetical protein
MFWGRYALRHAVADGVALAALPFGTLLPLSGGGLYWSTTPTADGQAWGRGPMLWRSPGLGPGRGGEAARRNHALGWCS